MKLVHLLIFFHHPLKEKKRIFEQREKERKRIN
jgi:heme exporter protein D